jgi:LacI family transcriptional regulator
MASRTPRPISLHSKPTIDDIARLAGVSKKTVSRVINKSPLLSAATRAKIEAVISSTGFVPNPQARALALGRNSLVALLHDNPNAQMVLNMQQGMLEALRPTDFALVIRQVNRASPGMLEDIRNFVVRQRLYGIAILPPISEIDAIANICREVGCRYVRMGSTMLDDAEHMVTSNDRDAVQAATRYLIEVGHRRIGLVAGPHGFQSANVRREGFEAALREAGLKLPRSFIAEGQYTFDSGVEAANQLLDLMPRPTAIFACNDEMAAGVLHTAHVRGIRMPEELSVIGFDDTPIAARVWPTLTTVRWPIVSMGRSAALKLLSGIALPVEEALEPTTFLSTLIKRGSVAPPSPSLP